MHWLWVLWFDYGYPSLKGNGPEAIIQVTIGVLLAFGLKRAHDKMDHIIKHHPAIPPFSSKSAPPTGPRSGTLAG